MNLKELEPTLAPPLSGGDRSLFRRSVAGDYDSDLAAVFLAAVLMRNQAATLSTFQAERLLVSACPPCITFWRTECRRRRSISGRRHPRHANDLLRCVGRVGTTPPYKCRLMNCEQ